MFSILNEPHYEGVGERCDYQHSYSYYPGNLSVWEVFLLIFISHTGNPCGLAVHDEGRSHTNRLRLRSACTVGRPSPTEAIRSPWRLQTRISTRDTLRRVVIARCTAPRPFGGQFPILMDHTRVPRGWSSLVLWLGANTSKRGMWGVGRVGAGVKEGPSLAWSTSVSGDTGSMAGRPGVSTKTVPLIPSTLSVQQCIPSCSMFSSSHHKKT